MAWRHLWVINLFAPENSTKIRFEVIQVIFWSLSVEKKLELTTKPFKTQWPSDPDSKY